MHGANRTGRPFTGDYAGDLLYGTLHKFGFATVAKPLDDNTQANPDLHLLSCRITNAVRCLPPQNKPEPGEIKLCNDYLAEELAALPNNAAVMALGTIAHQAVLSALALRKSSFPFAHGACHVLNDGVTLFDSYHCSRYNTQTRRLTAPMFEAVVQDIKNHIGFGQGECWSFDPKPILDGLPLLPGCIISMRKGCCCTWAKRSNLKTRLLYFQKPTSLPYQADGQPHRAYRNDDYAQ
jgi:uracil-DNA glycosylase family 4